MRARRGESLGALHGALASLEALGLESHDVHRVGF
jgi:hypothetical protein